MSLFLGPLEDAIFGLDPAWSASVETPLPFKVGFWRDLRCPVPSTREDILPAGFLTQPDWPESTFVKVLYSSLWTAVVDFLTTPTEDYLAGEGLRRRVKRTPEEITADNRWSSVIGNAIRSRDLWPPWASDEEVVDGWWLIDGFLVNISGRGNSLADRFLPKWTATVTNQTRNPVASLQDFGAELAMVLFAVGEALQLLGQRFVINLPSSSTGGEVFQAMARVIRGPFLTEDAAPGYGTVPPLLLMDFKDQEESIGLSWDHWMAIDGWYLAGGNSGARRLRLERLPWSSVKNWDISAAIPGGESWQLSLKLARTADLVGLIAHELSHLVLSNMGQYGFGFGTSGDEHRGPDFRTYVEIAPPHSSERSVRVPNDAVDQAFDSGDPAPDPHWICEWISVATQGAACSAGFLLGSPTGFRLDAAIAYFMNVKNFKVCRDAIRREKNQNYGPFLVEESDSTLPCGCGPNRWWEDFSPCIDVTEDYPDCNPFPSGFTFISPYYLDMASLIEIEVF